MSYKFNEFQLKWLEALESGEYKQCKNYLKQDFENEIRYCCLGVGCELAGIKLEKDIAFRPDIYCYNQDDKKYVGQAPDELVDKLKLKGCLGTISEDSSLVGKNDSGYTFKQIAQFCRENPEKVFTE